jgi:hypothetical protein
MSRRQKTRGRKGCIRVRVRQLSLICTHTLPLLLCNTRTCTYARAHILFFTHLWVCCVLSVCACLQSSAAQSEVKRLGQLLAALEAASAGE